MLPEISNHFHPGMERPRLSTTMQLVFAPTEEWNYAHHPFLARFRGRFFLCFSSGTHHEDDVGQRVMFTASDDFIHWDEARVLAQPDDPATELFIPQGLHVYDDTIVVYYLLLRYDPSGLKDGHRQMGTRGRTILGHYCKTSRDGVSWSSAQPIRYYGGNMPVRKLRSGRLFACGGRHNGYTDHPDGLHDWHCAAVCPEGWGNAPGDVREEDDMPGLVSDTHVALCESSMIEQDDGTLYMYLRSATPWLWACRSTDGGETWSLPEKTNFTDNRTKFFMDRLPDGRYYYVGTPDPFPPRTRHVLALSLSRDGLDWTEHYLLADAQYKGRYPGIDKNGVYGYPSVLVEDKTMYLTFSINKEMIVVMKADLNAV